MTIVDLDQARTRLSKLLDRVHAGEEIILAKSGKPYTRLVRVEPRPSGSLRRPGQFKHLIPQIPDSVLFAPPAEEELRQWQGR